MSDVFISYKAEDRRRIQPLVQALQADGLSVWWDEQIGGGAAWRHAIESELNAAKCVLVVWSTRSVGPEGTFVQDEATRAQQRHVYVPLLIDKVHLPLGFGETQALPLVGWRGNRSDPRFQAVLDAVHRNVGKGSRPSGSSAHHHREINRRAVLIGGGGVAAVAVAGVGAWELLRPTSASASGTIAVLPFTNLSGDPSQAYFSDGIADEIRSALTRISGLKVAGSTSSGVVRNDDAQTAARKLGVANILTGSVRQSASTIRISAELIDGETGLDKWSQDYDRNPGDTIKIQTDIAQNVASAMSAALGQAAQAVVSVGGTSNAAAQDLFLKAKAQMRADDSEASYRKALGLLDSAITLDPSFADAFAQKSHAINIITGYFTPRGQSFAPGYEQAEAIARHAISLAPKLAGAHLALGFTLLARLNVAAAAAEIEKGYALAPGDPDTLLGYATFLSRLGRSEEAIRIAKQAQADDPLNPDAFTAEVDGQLSARRYAESLAADRKALALAPNQQVTRTNAALALISMGRNEEALAEMANANVDGLYRNVVEAIVAYRRGDKASSDAALKAAQDKYGDLANYQYADVHAQRGERDEAIAALDRAWSFRDPGLVYLNTDVLLDPIRPDPRITLLLKKMNFPSA